MEQSNYTIIGFGLAGATLAWQFHLKGIPVSVYDNGKNHSSRVAAGMINPIIFKRLTKGWNVDVLFPAARQFYSTVEDKIGIKLLSHRSIVRVFASIEEQNNWAALEGDGRFDQYLQAAEDLNHPFVDAPFGVGKVNSLGHLDVNAFLDGSKKYLSQNGVQFIDEAFSSDQIENNDQYIFCEGYQLVDNPYFNYIPMKPSHGDVLTIHAPDLKYDDILNKNMFVLPIGNDQYKIGSTYNWQQDKPVPTQEGKDELLERLKTFCRFEFNIVDHEGGIRPTVSDRRPLLGTHPSLKKLHVFNGLGTKGVSIAPFYAIQMLKYLIEDCKLDDEVNVQRYEKHFYA
ncbi:FAD-binding oxidoreductase [Paracrocinitomix mangrovi]|uniref:NAD(P)/FAD-dependent oxidoreductase n=1 Tax=Paracrocinitomix mangrovi TaxID=2862509 RepID=UPI001C8DFDD5|nr:FAD-dependent oxidoreductase [Paracrocinitomix mangrovi]UKN03670.1 FAD-binding oxidoreductase [Paracrocinitomix mangrovi]